MNKIKAMKKIIVLIAVVLCSACTKEHVMTEFYVKNTSNKTISFEATIVKPSTITGTYEVTLPFTVNANDKVLARKIEFQKDGKDPQKWFTRFVIYPVEGIQMNDPNLSENWVKSNKDGTPVYEFTLNK